MRLIEIEGFFEELEIRSEFRLVVNFVVYMVTLSGALHADKSALHLTCQRL